MTASCPYCHEVMFPPNPDNIKVWRCFPCNVAQELLGYGVSIIYISCVIKGQEYTVRLDGRDTKTYIIRWNITADGFGIGDTFIVAPRLLNITPSNVVERIKTYMVFL